MPCRCAKDEFNPRGQLFFTPLVQAMRVLIHLGETVPESAAADETHAPRMHLTLGL